MIKCSKYVDGNNSNDDDDNNNNHDDVNNADNNDDDDDAANNGEAVGRLQPAAMDRRQTEIVKHDYFFVDY